jgi:hypothetical protein
MKLTNNSCYKWRTAPIWALSTESPVGQALFGSLRSYEKRLEE